MVLLAAARLTVGQPLDSIVARVDETAITWSQVVQEAALLRLQGNSQASADSRTLDAMIRRRLFVGAAERLRLEVGPAEVTGEAEAQTRAAGDPGAFLEAARALGISEAQLKARAREVLLTRRYLQLQREGTYVPESEVRAYLAARGEAGEEALAAARDQARAELGSKKAEGEIERWIARQFAEGRVRLQPGGMGE